MYKEIWKKLITVIWCLTRWWDWCLSEDEKKKNLFLVDEK